MKTRVEAVDVVCPDCGAPIGSTCVNSRGFFRRPHTSRLVKFGQAEIDFEAPQVTPIGNASELLRRGP